jgi:hypothetical protein
VDNYFDQMKNADNAQYVAIYEGLKGKIPAELREKFTIEQLVNSFKA